MVLSDSELERLPVQWWTVERGKDLAGDRLQTECKSRPFTGRRHEKISHSSEPLDLQ